MKFVWRGCRERISIRIGWTKRIAERDWEENAQDPVDTEQRRRSVMQLAATTGPGLVASAQNAVSLLPAASPLRTLALEAAIAPLSRPAQGCAVSFSHFRTYLTPFRNTLTLSLFRNSLFRCYHFFPINPIGISQRPISARLARNAGIGKNNWDHPSFVTPRPN